MDRKLFSYFVMTIVLIGLIFRVIWLGNIPGINGDEAEYGVRVVNFIRGDPIWWWTNNGNILNPFYSGLLLLIQLMFPISGYVLRLPALISGLLMLFVSFVGGKKLFGTKLAVRLLLVLTVLPINIAYSRFGWDTSQSILFSVVVLWLGFAKRWKWSLISLVGAFLVHPTNIMLVLPMLGIWFGDQLQNNNWKNIKWKQLILPSTFVGVLFRLWWEMVYKTQTSSFSFLNYDGSLWEKWSLYFFRIGRLLSGATVYEYIAGSLNSEKLLVFDVVFLTVGSLAWLIAAKHWKKWPITFRGFTLGVVAALILFGIVVGPEALRPHVERYSLWMVFPLALILTFTISRLELKFVKSRELILAVLTLACLFFYWQFYFQHLINTGGSSHRTFVTANPEPKQQVVSWIQSEINNDEEALVVTEDWWLYWPIRYLAGEDSNIEVVGLENYITHNENKYYENQYFVGFVSGIIESDIVKYKELLEVKRVRDGSGEDLLIIWE